MATTRIIKHHVSRGQTIAASLSDRFGYRQNPDKTDNGELIHAYECDHETADAEFALSKAQYPAMVAFFESDAGQQEFAEWKARQDTAAAKAQSDKKLA